MVPQRLVVLSDREAVDRITFDLRWKYAALDFDYGGLFAIGACLTCVRDCDGHSVRIEFLEIGLPGRASGSADRRSKRVTESTALYDVVATQDTRWNADPFWRSARCFGSSTTRSPRALAAFVLGKPRRRLRRGGQAVVRLGRRRSTRSTGGCKRRMRTQRSRRGSMAARSIRRSPYAAKLVATVRRTSDWSSVVIGRRPTSRVGVAAATRVIVDRRIPRIAPRHASAARELVDDDTKGHVRGSIPTPDHHGHRGPASAHFATESAVESNDLACGRLKPNAEQRVAGLRLHRSRAMSMRPLASTRRDRRSENRSDACRDSRRRSLNKHDRRDRRQDPYRWR